MIGNTRILDRVILCKFNKIKLLRRNCTKDLMGHEMRLYNSYIHLGALTPVWDFFPSPTTFIQLANPSSSKLTLVLSLILSLSMFLYVQATLMSSQDAIISYLNDNNLQTSLCTLLPAALQSTSIDQPTESPYR